MSFLFAVLLLLFVCTFNCFSYENPGVLKFTNWSCINPDSRPNWWPQHTWWSHTRKVAWFSVVNVAFERTFTLFLKWLSEMHVSKWKFKNQWINGFPKIFRWANSNVVGIICPPGWNRVRWTPKFRVGWSPPCPPASGITGFYPNLSQAATCLQVRIQVDKTG